MEKYVVAVIAAIICGRHQGPIDYEARVADAIKILKAAEKAVGVGEQEKVA